MILAIFLVAGFISSVSGECANACNGHGKCTSYDMCICNRNWQANDCSERVCSFGLAHVDTPKGDLDMSGDISGPMTTVSENSAVYPYGTTEMFPQMEDSDHQVLKDSAHYYMECSNKGTCIRTTGECICYDGYDGVACQRASCPGTPVPCSGKGVCRSKKQLANDFHGNSYELWDKSTTMGCQCDAGYYGPDCSQRTCKYGVDPLYLDDSSTVKYSVFNVAQFTNILTVNGDSISTIFNDGTPLAGTGYWALRFYDNHGEDWLTSAIKIDASCDDVVNALEALPNNVVPMGSMKCVKVSQVGAYEQGGFGVNGTYPNAFTYDKTGNLKNNYYMAFRLALWDMQLPANAIETDTSSLQVENKLYSSQNLTSLTDLTKISGVIYRLHFNGNPGALREPEIELYLDGKRPSLASTKPAVSGYGKTSTKVWTDGQQGENDDFFGDHCDGVTVQVSSATISPTAITALSPNTRIVYYLTSFTPAEKALLKACLGDSNVASDNLEVYNWDYGSQQNPHLIKLVRTVSTFMDGGYYAVIWYDTTITLDNAAGATGFGVDGTFRLAHPFKAPDNENLGANEHDSWEVYTTKGTLQLTSTSAQAVFGFGSKNIYTTVTAYDDSSLGLTYSGDISCANNVSTTTVLHCLNTTDIFTMLAWDVDTVNTANPNPRYLNLYKANHVYTASSKNLGTDVVTGVGSAGATSLGITTGSSIAANYLTHVIETDLSTNWASSPLDQAWEFNIYKFIPAPESTYSYVAECANRGLCDTTMGSCACFPGYTSDSCSEQSSLSL